MPLHRKGGMSDHYLDHCLGHYGILIDVQWRVNKASLHCTWQLMRGHRVHAAYLFITCHQQTYCHDQSRNPSPVCDQYVLTMRDNLSILIKKKHTYILRAKKLIKKWKTVNRTKIKLTIKTKLCNQFAQYSILKCIYFHFINYQ